jgi:hypothetical protein
MSVQYCQTGMRAERNVSVNRFLRNSVDLHGASATPMRVVCACRSEKEVVVFFKALERLLDAAVARAARKRRPPPSCGLVPLRRPLKGKGPMWPCSGQNCPSIRRSPSLRVQIGLDE